MPIEAKMHEGQCQCRISGELRIWHATDIWNRLHPLLGASDPLCIDLQDVTACDGAGVQILCQVLRKAADRETITVGGVSEAVLSALQQAGMEKQVLSALQGER